MFTASPWSDEKTEELKALVAQGLSNTRMAEKLGVTRGAVSGKVDRLGLARTKRPDSRVPRAPREPKKKQEKQTIFRFVAANGNSNALRILKTVQAELPNLRCSEIKPRNIPLSELEDNDCRYIPGDDYLYCARPKKPGSSYCWACHDIVWVKPIPSKPRSFGMAA